MGFFSKGLKNEFERAVVNEPSMFEPLKFYCTYKRIKFAWRYAKLKACTNTHIQAETHNQVYTSSTHPFMTDMERLRACSDVDSHS